MADWPAITADRCRKMKKRSRVSIGRRLEKTSGSFQVFKRGDRSWTGVQCSSICAARLFSISREFTFNNLSLRHTPTNFVSQSLVSKKKQSVLT